MKSKLFLRVISVLFYLVPILNAQASSISPEDAVLWAKNSGKILIDTFHEKDIDLRYQKLDELFDQYIDVSYVGKFVLGKYWKQMTPEQHSKYMALFTRYVQALYKTFPLDFINNIKYEVGQAFLDNKFTVVNVIVYIKLQKDVPEEKFLLSFRLHKTDQGIRLVDIKIGESSLLLSYRREFYRHIAANEEEIEWFLEDLEDMAKSAERKNQAKLNR